MRLILLLCGILLVGTLTAEDTSRTLLINRIRPLGAVHLDKPRTTSVSTQAPATRNAEEIYNQHCSVCHASGVAGAPKFQQANEWDPRFKKAGGLKGLLENATKGMNAMPPMGTCQNCTQDELMHAITYMLPKS